MTTDRNALSKLVAIPAGAIEANTAGVLPNALAISNAAQPAQTNAVMNLTASLTGESSPRDAK